MAFGRKTGSLKKLKETLAKGGNGSFIKFVPKNGSLNVRFIQEPEEWVSYMEHYDQVLKASYPCSGEKDCPGCVSGERKSSRYLANAVNLDDQDRVIPLQLPKDLANRLVIRYEKWGTITDRDIELSRNGEGLDTTYDFDAGSPDKKRIDKYQPLDLLEVLEKVYDGVFGAGEAEEEEEPVKARAPRTRRPAGKTTSRRASEPSEDDEADDEDDEEDEAPAKPARRPAASRTSPNGVRGRAKSKAAAVDDDDDADPDDEDEPVWAHADKEPAKPATTRRRKPAPEPEPEEDDEDDEDDEGVEYTEDDLEGMTLGELRAIARDMQPPVATKGLSKPELIDAILGDEDE